MIFINDPLKPITVTLIDRQRVLNDVYNLYIDSINMATFETTLEDIIEATEIIRSVNV